MAVAVAVAVAQHTRWIQWGAYSGVFRTHDRGMSGGSCADANPPNCAIVELWKTPWHVSSLSLLFSSAFTTRSARLTS